MGGKLRCGLGEDDFQVHLSTPPKINMTIENPPFEDVFPRENGDFPM